MRSNGFGSLEQTIVIHVPKGQETMLTSLIDCAPREHRGEPGRSYFSWKRWTTRTGDDEDVVFELFMLISGPREELDWTIEGPRKEIEWEIDWGLSEY